jgi:molybdopterin converting factor subunit 1
MRLRVQVLMYAGARQIVGSPSISVELAEPATVLDLRTQLKAEYPALANLLPNMMVAVDHEFAVDSQRLKEGSEIALIPPVSGGHDG